MYGKIIDGKLIVAPNPIALDGYIIHNPRGEQYKNKGYFEIIESEYPTDEKYYVKQYVERDGAIYSEWVEAETPEISEEPVVPTTEERVTVLEGKTEELGNALDMILDGVTE